MKNTDDFKVGDRITGATVKTEYPGYGFTATKSFEGTITHINAVYAKGSPECPKAMSDRCQHKHDCIKHLMTVHTEKCSYSNKIGDDFIVANCSLYFTKIDDKINKEKGGFRRLDEEPEVDKMQKVKPEVEKQAMDENTGVSFHVGEGNGIENWLEILVGESFDSDNAEAINDWYYTLDDNCDSFREVLDAERECSCTECPFKGVDMGVLEEDSPNKYYTMCNFLCGDIHQPDEEYLCEFFRKLNEILEEECIEDIRSLFQVKRSTRVIDVPNKFSSVKKATPPPAPVAKKAVRSQTPEIWFAPAADHGYKEEYVEVDRKFADRPAKLKGDRIMKKTGMLNLDGMMAKFIQKTDGVVLDMTTGKIGIKDSSGTVITLMEDAQGNLIPAESLFDLSMEIPAYAIKTSLDKINAGDIILTGKTNTPQFVGSVDLAKSTVKLIKTDGHVGTQVTVYNPIFGGGSLLVVPNMLGTLIPTAGGASANPMGNMMQMMMISKMLGGDDLPFDSRTGRPSDKDGMGKLMSTMLVMQMMGGMGGGAVAAEGANPMMNMIMMQKMLGNDDGGDNMMEMMMLMNMFGAGGAVGAGGMFGGMFGGAAAPAVAKKTAK